MNYYRLYLMDAGNGIQNVVELVSDTDEDAAATAASHQHGHAKELWNKDRLVRRYEAAAAS